MNSPHISSTISHQQSGFKFNIRIDNFLDFVISNGQLRTDDVHLFNTDWFAQPYLGCYNASKKIYEKLDGTLSAKQRRAEGIMFAIGAKREEKGKTNSFGVIGVHSVFRFKPNLTDEKFETKKEYFQKFSFNSSNDFSYEYCPCYIKIDVCIYFSHFLYESIQF